MMRVEAVIKMLSPEFNISRIAPKHRNPWFKRGTLYTSALDVMSKADKPLSARETMLALLDGKEPGARRPSGHPGVTAGSSRNGRGDG